MGGLCSSMKARKLTHGHLKSEEGSKMKPSTWAIIVIVAVAIITIVSGNVKRPILFLITSKNWTDKLIKKLRKEWKEKEY